MGKAIGWALALGLILVCPGRADAEPPASGSISARMLLQECLKRPSREGVAKLAEALAAEPYSIARRRRELTTRTTNYQERSTGRDQRTTTTVREFRGWDLPGPGAGTLEYQEDATDTVWVDRPTGQTLTPVQSAVGRSCKLQAPVANARAIFEMYERLTEQPYGVRISADRRWIDVFMFEPARFDIELTFSFEAPVAGLHADAAQQEGRIVLYDGGPRFINGVSKGIATVELTRASLLAGLDQPATMNFFNMELDPVVQRLTAR